MARRIAVVGATGPTGGHVIDIALARGHEVVAYARRPEAIPSRPGLTVVGGSLDDIETFSNAIRGCAVLVCTLGTRSRRERGFMTKHLPLVTNAMQRADLTHLVLMSALGGGEVPPHSRGIARGIFVTLSRWVFGDRTISERALAATSIHWCAVYPSFLSDGESCGELDVVDMSQVLDVRDAKIPRIDVAKVLLDLAEEHPCSRRRVTVAPKGKVRRV